MYEMLEFVGKNDDVLKVAHERSDVRIYFGGKTKLSGKVTDVGASLLTAARFLGKKNPAQFTLSIDNITYQGTLKGSRETGLVTFTLSHPVTKEMWNIDFLWEDVFKIPLMLYFHLREKIS